MSLCFLLPRVPVDSRMLAVALLALLAACGSAPVDTTASPTPAAAGPPVVFADLTLVPQPGWIVEEPSSDMRLAQYRLPRAAGDDADAELVAYHFGAGGGSVEANVERWCGQFEQPDGRDSKAVAEVAERTIGGETATVVELRGTYVGETFPGSGEHHRDFRSAMRAAIVPSDSGAVYVKLLGPQRTVEHWDASWEALLDALDG